LEALRGLPFLTEVATASLSRAGVRSFIEELLDREYPPADLQAEEETLRYFGFLGAGQGLKSIYLDTMESQVAGLYDPDRKTLYVVPSPALGPVTLAHELAHALMDQHFGLNALEENARGDDDRVLALGCLVEGEASMVMMLWAVQSNLDPDIPSLPGGVTAAALQAAEAGMAALPAFLRETLLFPYLGGSVWAADVMRRGGGLKALDAFFRDPPESTEQILHPERSQPPRDRPSTIDPELLISSMPSGTPVVKRGSMGEFALRFLLGGSDEKEAVAAAEGWDADQYLLAGEPGARSLTWVSVWDTVQDAAEFRERAPVWLSIRARQGDASTGGNDSAVEQRGRVVVVARGGGDSGIPKAAERAASIASRLPSGIEFR